MKKTNDPNKVIGTKKKKKAGVATIVKKGGTSTGKKKESSKSCAPTGTLAKSGKNIDKFPSHPIFICLFCHKNQKKRKP